MAWSERVFRALLCGVFVVFLRIGTAQGHNVSDTQTVQISEEFNATFRFFPAQIDALIVDQTTDVYFTVLEDADSASGSSAAGRSFTLRVACSDTDLAEIVGESLIPITINSDSSENNYTFTVKGKFLGRTRLRFLASISGDATPTSSPDDWGETSLSYPVAVIREERIIDVMFIALVSMFVILSNVGMGCKVDIEVIKEVLRRPVAPTIGFFCQFIIMPALAFSLTKLLSLKGGQGLGFFATGCAPGGGASNMYTFLFNSDVSLSVTMTLISVITAFGMVPLWLLTLGQQILDQSEGDVKIPYQNILISLATIIIPVGVGLLIQKKKPLWAKKIIRCLTPFFAIFIIFMFTAGVYCNLYLFKLFTPELVIGSILLPYVGFLLGGVLATVFRQSRLRILAIAIETGIQNTGIPIILLKYSLPQPEADLSVVAPVMVAIFTPIPLWIALGVLEVRKRCFKQPEFTEVETDEKALDPEVDSNENETLVENGSAPSAAAPAAANGDGKTTEMKVMSANNTQA